MGSIINALLLLLGSLVGIRFKTLIGDNYTKVLTQAMGLCTLGVGIVTILNMDDIFCVTICMAVGSFLGEYLHLEDKLKAVGSELNKKFAAKADNAIFVEGFVTASVLFCSGAMGINGAIEEGLTSNCNILVTKGVMDGVQAFTLSAAIGAGVAFSAVPVLIFEGIITLLAKVVGGFLTAEVIAEIGCVGGISIIAVGCNIMRLGRERLRVGNMIPAVFMPIVYAQIVNLLERLVLKM